MNRILVVDDDKESRNLLTEILEENGYTVCAVGDGVAARELLAGDAEYGVVIADLRMPQESGLELLRKLREQQSSQPVILMSSFLSPGERKDATALGAYALFEKPLRLGEVLRVVGQLATPSPLGIVT